MASWKKLILLLAAFCAVVLLTSSGIVATNHQTKLNGDNGLPAYDCGNECYNAPSYGTSPGYGGPGYGRKFGAKGVHDTATAKTDKNGPKN
ncbi:hypothetical protein K7X08_013519 [Anisodus acutangulus]|uniref:Uncharacterized protein n=1 Tax=Anisodus acutangulus TaxID=402998 RepID=A0A9Q1LKG4_9SOLA|nr:hypothetical protein K7X08_013519 [Anisodus acutangulus]